MENTIENQFKDLSNSIQDLIDQKIRLFKVVLVEKLAKSIYMLFFLIILLFFLSLVLVFASVTLAQWLSTSLGNLYSGYLIVTGIYIVMTLLFLIFRKSLLLNPITRSIYHIIVSDDSEKEEYQHAA